ncbi:MAG TPA: hypothetical protein VMB48_12030 [Steroidobacteraceae bacterium]|nr:hypothetical protein [Steroidobacteraceae bacterium]
MSASDRRAPVAVAEAAPPAVPPSGEGDWVERMQRARSRQAAISRNIYTWSNYKNWADQVKGSWEPGKEPKK